VDASVSKFSVSGTPSDVILPPSVSANEGFTRFERLATQIWRP
jgi:hypothetical protein